MKIIKHEYNKANNNQFIFFYYLINLRQKKFSNSSRDSNHVFSFTPLIKLKVFIKYLYFFVSFNNFYE